MTKKAPKRRIEMNLKVSADSIDELVSYLRNFAFEVSTGTRTGVSGGYSTGAVYQIVEDESITHESWAANLEKYLAESSDEKGQTQ